MPPTYGPWPEDTVYRPGQGAAPPARPRLSYGDSPEVGDLPRLGKQSGDCRCDDITGVTPCSFCVAEKVRTYKYDARQVMPGFPSNDAMGENWFTGMRSQHPHPFQVATPEMNTGRGCDSYGRAYDAPPRYGYIEIFDFDESEEDFSLGKGIEVDWGPPRDSPEFGSAMESMVKTPAFEKYAEFMKSKDPAWEWRSPAERRPWEAVERVLPNPREFSAEHPVDQHLKRLESWGREEHEAWPEGAFGGAD